MRVAGPVCACAALLLWWWLGGAAAAPRAASAAPVNVEEGGGASPAAPAEEATATGSGEPSESPSLQVLEGTVVDPEGKGVEQITVRGTYLKTSSCYRMYLGFETVRTDESGRFRMDVHPRAVWVELSFDAPGWVQPPARTVHTYGTELADGTSADARALRLERGEGWPRQKIVLERGEAIAGIVETSAGVPVPDVRVEASWPGGTALIRTDERGRFSLPVPTPAVLTARAVRGSMIVEDGLPPWPMSEGTRPRYEDLLAGDAEATQGPVPPGTRDVRIVLRELHRLEMLVLDPDGPVNGYATVRVTELRSSRSVSYEPHIREGLLATRAPSLAPGTYRIDVYPQGDLLPARAIVSVPGAPVEIRCERALVIEGLLEGDYIVNFEITWTGPGNPLFEAGVRQRGRTLYVSTADFVLRGVGEGVGDLYARRPGDRRCALVTGCRAGRGVVRMTLVEGCSIDGRVEVPEGLDPSALDVRAVRGLLTQDARVRPDGTFSIVGLPPGEFRLELVTSVYSGGRPWLHDARDGVVVGTEEVVLRVRLPAGKGPDGS
jgi:hypothetical protein